MVSLLLPSHSASPSIQSFESEKQGGGVGTKECDSGSRKPERKGQKEGKNWGKAQ
jgi:hypothetical protein